MKCFNAKRVKKSHTVKLEASPENVFPLLCPIREEEWIYGWENDTYELIYSESGFNEEGCVFKTSYPDGNESLWTCTKYDNENCEAEFLVYVKDLAIRKLNILLKINEEDTTDARFEYTVTSITEKGNIFVDNLGEDTIKNASRLGMMINFYIQSSKKLRIDK